jgi:FkbM family methyltransferase
MTDDTAPFRLAEVLGEATPDRIEILDVGAMAEGRPRYDALLQQGLCRITGFEANKDEVDTALAALPPGSRVLPYAMGDGKEATLHVTRYPGCTSLLEPNPEVIDMFVPISAMPPGGNFAVMATEQIQTHRLDDVVECPQADYVKLDVQGAELMVLENGVQKISQAVVIETEVEFVELYRDQPLFGEIQTFLRRQGFAFHKLIDIVGMNFRPMRSENWNAATSQFLWADGVFVRDVSKLEAYTPAQLLKAAAILHDVYFSYDIVCRLLYMHDLAAGSAFAEVYWRRIDATDHLPLQFANMRTEL